MAGPAILKFLVVGDASKAVTEIGKVEKTGGNIKRWATGVGGAIAAAFAVDKIRQFVDAGAQLQDNVAASQVIFGDAARSVEAWSKGTADAMGVSQTAALDAANTFATFGKSAGLTGTDLSGFSTELVQLSGDLASFRGTTTEQAITAIGAALRGESEPMRQYGVLLDDATLKARAMALGIADGTKPLTAQQKVMAAQAEILAQTTDAQGDFARTSDSAANQQKKLQAQMDNVQATIGTALLPLVQQLLPALSAMAGFVQENSSWMVPLAAGIAGVALSLKVASVAAGLFNVALSAGTLGIIALVVAAVAGLAYVIVRNWDTIKAAAMAVWNWLKTNWPLLLAILTGPFGAAVLVIVRNWGTIKSTVLGVFDAIKGAATSAWQFVVGKFQAIASAVTGVWDGVTDTINRFIDGWNRLRVPSVTFDIPGGNFLPGVPDSVTVGGWAMPRIPRLAQGGLVARTGLAVVHRGETFSGVGNALGSTTINVNVTAAGLGADAPEIQRAVVRALRGHVARNGPLDVPVRAAG